jgi:transcriptional regulator with XRE-family HTH domain
MSNKEKFLQLVTDTDTTLISEVNERIRNREMLRESQNIALKVLARLEELHWTQRRLAEAMGVSAQQVSKIVSGKENLTIESLVKLEQVLGIPFLAKSSAANELMVQVQPELPKYQYTIANYASCVMEEVVPYQNARVYTNKAHRIPKSKFQLA